MSAPQSPTYFRPVNADTGELTLAVYFTAALFELLHAYEYDPNKQTDELAADVRDELDRRGIAIRPTISHGRLRIMQETDPDEHGFKRKPMVFATVIAYLTDAEPDDPRLAELLDGFHGERVGSHIRFEIPTTDSEASAAERERAEAEAVRQYRAKADSERAAAAEKDARTADNPFADDDMSDLFD